MEDSDDIEAATEIAIQCGALERCSDCGSTWTTDDFDADDSESMDELLTTARDKAEGDPELELPEDDDALRAALRRVMSNAAVEKNCDH
jgi:hypothetical protein